MAKRQLTKAQREYVLNRDGRQCCFHTYYKGRGLVRCPNKTDLHVHHVKPHRWLSAKFKVVIESPYNLVTLCKNHHNNFIHPDMGNALRLYHINKKSIEETFDGRRTLMNMEIPYWVQRWDDFLKWWAKEATNAYNVEWPD